MPTPDTTPPSHFIRDIIAEDRRRNKNDGRVVTRFPPEPNGYPHIGHAKSICLNFGLAAENDGVCHLRFDDTNPTKEEVEYVEAFKTDVRWLGFDWRDKLFYASDYFEQLYQYAVQLIKAGKAYVCSLSPDEMRQYRGTLTVPGEDSPYRTRSVAENLDLFERMRAGEFPRCMTMRIACRMRSRGSRTRSARWNSKTIAPCTTGSSTPCRRRAIHSRSNLPA